MISGENEAYGLGKRTWLSLKREGWIKQLTFIRQPSNGGTVKKSTRGEGNVGVAT